MIDSEVRSIRSLRSSGLAVAAIFLVNGAVFANWVTRIPAVKDATGASAGALGLALLGIAGGSLLTMPFAGRLCDRLGSRVVVVASGLAVAAALVNLAHAPNVASLTVALALYGGSFGLLDVSMNVQAVAVVRLARRPVMPWFHAAFSFGGLVGAGTGGLAAGVGLSPAWHFAFAGLVATGIVLAVRPLLLDDRHRVTSSVGASDEEADVGLSVAWDGAGADDGTGEGAPDADRAVESGGLGGFDGDGPRPGVHRAGRGAGGEETRPDGVTVASDEMWGVGAADGWDRPRGDGAAGPSGDDGGAARDGPSVDEGMLANPDVDVSGPGPLPVAVGTPHTGPGAPDGRGVPSASETLRSESPTGADAAREGRAGLPDPHDPHPARGPAGSAEAGARRDGARLRLLLAGLGGIAASAAIVEGAMADWTALFLRDVRDLAAGTAALGFAAFSIAMTVGRLGGEATIRRLGPVRVLRLGGALAAAGLTLAVLVAAPAAAVVGFGLVGLGVSSAFPLALTTAGEASDGAGGREIAAVSVVGYLGFLVGPPVIGLLADAVGLRLALLAAAVPAAALVLLASVLRPARKLA